MRYYSYLGGTLILVAVAVSPLIIQALRPAPGVTPENFRRLHAGMTEKEAEAIMGRPADTKERSKGCDESTWSSNGYRIELDISYTSRIECGSMDLPDGSTEHIIESRESPLDWFRGKLGL